MCVCVCVYERERERESVCVCERERTGEQSLAGEFIATLWVMFIIKERQQS